MKFLQVPPKAEAVYKCCKFQVLSLALWLKHCATSRKVGGRIPIVLLEFFSYIIHPAALWPWGRLIL